MEKKVAFLVDDDIDDQEIFQMALQEVNPAARCFFANDGVYALEKFKAEKSFAPDVIFIDINMPRMNGIECLTEIKKLPRLKRIPVYMYSTSSEPKIVEDCLKLGATGFIRKEVKTVDLENKLSQILNRLQVAGNERKKNRTIP